MANLIPTHNPVLTKIKQALASAYLPSALPSLLPGPQFSTAPGAELVESFSRELTALRGQVYQAASQTEAAEIVLRLLKEEAAAELLTWDDTQLPVADLVNAVDAAGYTILDSNLPSEPESRKTKLAELGRAVVGITGATAGLADTGTLVLVSGPGRPRLTSLLPPVHIALLSVASILPDLPGLFAKYSTLAQQGSNLILITGPSRTSDIELTPVWGVHGPKKVHVILV